MTSGRAVTEYATDTLRAFLARLSTQQVMDYAARLGLEARRTREATENAICYIERVKREGK